MDGRGNNEIGLTKVLALEVAEHGITSNAICPADVRTPLVERQIKEPARQHQISRDDVIRKITTEPAAIHRLLDPEEVSAVVLYLCDYGCGPRHRFGADGPVNSIQELLV